MIICSVSQGPSPFPLLWTLVWIWDLGLGLGLDNKNNCTGRNLSMRQLRRNKPTKMHARQLKKLNPRKIFNNNLLLHILYRMRLRILGQVNLRFINSFSGTHLRSLINHAWPSIHKIIIREGSLNVSLCAQIHLSVVHPAGAALHSGNVPQHHGCVQSLRRQQAAHRQPLSRHHRASLHLLVSDNAGLL